jgi:hypothetical protein
MEFRLIDFEIRELLIDKKSNNSLLSVPVFMELVYLQNEG